MVVEWFICTLCRAKDKSFGQLGNYHLFLKQLGNFDFNMVIKMCLPLR